MTYFELFNLTILVVLEFVHIAFELLAVILSILLLLFGSLDGETQVLDRDFDFLDFTCVLYGNKNEQIKTWTRFSRTEGVLTSDALLPPTCSSSSFNPCSLISKSLARSLHELRIFLDFCSSFSKAPKRVCASLSLLSISKSSCT